MGNGKRRWSFYEEVNFILAMTSPHIPPKCNHYSPSDPLPVLQLSCSLFFFAEKKFSCGTFTSQADSEQLEIVPHTRGSIQVLIPAPRATRKWGCIHTRPSLCTSVI